MPQVAILGPQHNTMAAEQRDEVAKQIIYVFPLFSGYRSVK